MQCLAFAQPDDARLSAYQPCNTRPPTLGHKTHRTQTHCLPPIFSAKFQGMSTVRPLESTARGRAVAVLVESYDGQALCHDLLETLQREQPLGPADAGLAAELAIGVSRRRITCEHLAAKYYRGRWAGLRESIRVVMAVGVYQLCWLDRVPDYAAVDQSVRLMRRYGKGTAATANAILRKIAEVRGETITRTVDTPPRRFLPLEGDRGVLFNEDVFPDPARKPLDYLIAAYGYPPWLIERWHRLFKSELCRQVCEAGSQRPPLVLRPNRLRTTPDALRERLAADGVDCEIAEDGRSLIIRAAVTASEITPVSEGLCQPQDSTAQIALTLGAPTPGEFVIDLCAGSGTKSTQAAEMMNNEGLVLAADVNERKLARVEEAAGRLGIGIVRTAAMNGLESDIRAAGRSPDLILVDAPCLNTGVLSRRPEARYRAGHKALLEIVEIQRGILEHAVSLAGPQTRIVYSTCSLERAENEEQVRSFVADHPKWEIREEKFTLPTRSRDGGYAAVLIRKS